MLVEIFITILPFWGSGPRNVSILTRHPPLSLVGGTTGQVITGEGDQVESWSVVSSVSILLALILTHPDSVCSAEKYEW